MSVIIQQNVEILQVLCQQAVSFDAILGSLVNKFPSTGWTEAMLQNRLDVGVSQGLFKAVGTDPAGPVEGYSVNARAIFQNFALNRIYGCHCSQLLPVPVRQF